MTVTTNTATIRRTNTDVVSGVGHAYKVNVLFSTVEIAASESASTIDFGNIPSNARILAASRLYKDDLATSGSPTIDLGLFAVNSNITSDDDALNDGIAISNTTEEVRLIKDFANSGKRAWEFVNGQTSDPGGLLKVKGTTKDASTTATGSVSLELLYTLD